PPDDLVVHVGVVADDGHLVARSLEPTGDGVEGHVGPRVAQVAHVVDRRPADVHADLARLEGDEFFLAVGQGVEQPLRHPSPFRPDQGPRAITGRGTAVAAAPRPRKRASHAPWKGWSTTTTDAVGEKPLFRRRCPRAGAGPPPGRRSPRRGRRIPGPRWWSPSRSPAPWGCRGSRRCGRASPRAAGRCAAAWR